MIYNNENVLCDKIDNHIFFDALNNNGYSVNVLCNLFEEIEYETIDKYQFNCVLRRINKFNNVPVFDMLMCLEKYFAEPKKILSVLDNKTMGILKQETSKNYHIKLQECSLSEMFS